MSSKAQRTGLTLLSSFVVACWGIWLVDAITPGTLAGLGIRPRSMDGLSGVIAAPFLHGTLSHLSANSVPLLALGGLLLLADAKRFLSATLWAALGSGLVAWLLGPSGSVHIGASGIVFGYLGFLLSRGWFTRRLGLIALSLAVTAVWGGLVLGVLPGEAGVSWQSHVGGLLGGVWAARGVGKRPSRRTAGAGSGWRGLLGRGQAPARSTSSARRGRGKVGAGS